MKRRALISVYDKKGIVEFAKKLIEHDFEIVSTSGTAKLLRDKDIAVTALEKLTSFPEILDGRVKTLHPLVFAAILADRQNKEHAEEIKKLGILPIDVVAVNLYPFEDTVAKTGCTVDQAIEQIDIGGVSLIRAAAKNYRNVSVLVKPSQYAIYNEHLDKKTSHEELNTELAREAFEYISYYDLCISEYFKSLKNSRQVLSNSITLNFSCSEELRYGENPHQAARLYFKQKDNFNSIFEKLHGKELSYNNLLDIDSAYNLIKEFSDTTCAIIKHTNPCGICTDEILTNAYVKALSTDSVSAFGGIIIVNKQLDYETAFEMDKIFTEVIIAPGFEEKALELLERKKNRRLIKYKSDISFRNLDIRSVNGGLLVQELDKTVVDKKEMNCVTERGPSENEFKDLIFAMKVAKHTKSNSVVYAKDRHTLGIGGGQPSRVDSSNLAVEKALKFGFDLKGSSVASDAFFPFADGVIAAAKAGASAVIQPGGSVRDDEVISAANEHGLAMLFTSIRHFKH